MVTIDDKINLFSRIIYDEVNEKIKSKLDELEKIEEETIKKEEREIEEYRNRNIKKINEKAKSKLEKEILKLRVKEQKEILNLKENIINEVLYSLRKKVVEFTNSTEYMEYINRHLDNILKNIKSKNDIIIYFNKRDMERLSQFIREKNIEVSYETKDIIGGYIIQDKNNKFRIDCSLDKSIKDCKEKIGISITELFM
ncbi:MAG: V-type ATP synthase subunit E [Clostridium cochlearium]|uniref:V-type ATP synthase subunit E n=1 Tax=Clostridium cochlearium TaxID=1494 RepID=UPI00280B0A30|nr:V-type ATP synthase subunit E [Clostridium cochlearium]MDU1442780.1 V-type ATP synthase subunit E [Clostridium cochlearium]